MCCRASFAFKYYWIFALTTTRISYIIIMKTTKISYEEVELLQENLYTPSRF